MLESDLRSVEGGVEAVRRRMRGHDGDRAFTVAAIKGLAQVGLLGLGRKTGGRAAALHVYDDERKLGHDGKSEGLALEREAGAGSGSDGEVAGEGSADGGADARYLVLGLQRLGAEALMDGEFLKDSRSRRNGIGTAEQREAGLLGSGEQSPGGGLVAGHVAVGALLELGGSHRIGIGDGLHVGGIVEAVVQDLLVGLDHLRVLLGELALEVLVDVLEGPAVDVAGHAEREHVLAFVDGLGVHAEILEALLRKGGDGRYEERPVLDVELGEGILGLESGLLHSGLVESVAVNEDHGRGLAPFGVCLECGRVHGDQKVAEVSRRVDVRASDMHLEAGDSGDGAVRRADLRRIVRESGQFVSVDGRHIGKERPGELHAVTRIPRETNYNIFSINYLVLHYGLVGYVIMW